MIAELPNARDRQLLLRYYVADAHDAELMSADGRSRSYPELQGRLIS